MGQRVRESHEFIHRLEYRGRRSEAAARRVAAAGKQLRVVASEKGPRRKRDNSDVQYELHSVCNRSMNFALRPNDYSLSKRGP